MCKSLLALVALDLALNVLVCLRRGVKLFLGGLSWNTTEGKRVVVILAVEADAHSVLTDLPLTRLQRTYDRTLVGTGE